MYTRPHLCAIVLIWCSHKPKRVNSLFTLLTMTWAVFHYCTSMNTMGNSVKVYKSFLPTQAVGFLCSKDGYDNSAGWITYSVRHVVATDIHLELLGPQFHSNQKLPLVTNQSLTFNNVSSKKKLCYWLLWATRPASARQIW